MNHTTIIVYACSVYGKGWSLPKNLCYLPDQTFVYWPKHYYHNIMNTMLIHLFSALHITFSSLKHKFDYLQWSKCTLFYLLAIWQTTVIYWRSFCFYLHGFSANCSIYCQSGHSISKFSFYNLLVIMIPLSKNNLLY